MKISIIGYTGFIGEYLYNIFNDKYSVKTFSLRNKNIKNLSEEIIFDIFSSDYVINCAASLNPKTKNDIYLNTDFPLDLVNYNKKFQKNIIHFSTINVLIKERLDLYTKTKEESDIKLRDKNEIFIIRLPLVFQRGEKIYKKKGNVSQIYDYIQSVKLPIYPFIYPGHLYEPIDISQVGNKIEEIFLNKEKRKIINLVGDEKKSLWDIAFEIASFENKKLIKINTKYFFKFFPHFLKNFIRKQNNILQQLASIDHSKHEV